MCYRREVPTVKNCLTGGFFTLIGFSREGELATLSLLVIYWMLRHHRVNL
jgi:hypothetical protein